MTSISSSLSNRDTVFALLIPHPDNAPLAANGPGTATRTHSALASLTSLAAESRRTLLTDGGAAVRWDATATDDDLLTAATDSFFASRTDDVAEL